MENNAKLKRLATIIGVALGVYIVLKYMLPKVAPFILAWALCGLLYKPLYKIHEKTRLPMGWLGVFGVCIIGGVSLTAAWYFINSLTNFIGELLAHYPALGADFTEMACRFCTSVEGVMGLEEGQLWIFLNTQVQSVGQLLRTQGAAWVAKCSVPVFTGVIEVGAVVFIGFIAGIILIKNREEIAKALSHNYFASELVDIFTGVSRVCGSFFKTQGVIMICTAIICVLGLWFLKNPYALFLGVVIALLDALPLIGSGTILLPWAVFSVLGGEWPIALGLLVLYLLCTCLREVLEPKLMGDGLGINPFFMLMATFVGLSLFGLWGILLGPLGLVIILEILHGILGGAPTEL